MMSRKRKFIDSPTLFSYDNSMQADDIGFEVKPTHEQAPSGEPAQGLLQRLLSFLGAGEDPVRARRRLLRDIAKQLKTTRYKFYSTKTGEALPALAHFFHEIYLVLGPAQIIIDRAESSTLLKTIIIESSLDDQQLALRRYLGEEAVGKRAETIGAKELAADVREKLLAFAAIFDAERVSRIETVYRSLLVFLELLRFDYHFFLKKFDLRLPENDPKYLPHFEPTNCEYLLEELKDFLTVMYLIDGSEDWDALFAVLKEYRQVEIVARAGWQKLMKLIAEVRKSRVLELVVRYADHDPYYKVTKVDLSGAIVDSYLEKIKSTAEAAVQKTSRKNREQKIEVLTKSVFGVSPGERTKHYTEKGNALFASRMIGGYLYVSQLNLLKAFLLDCFKKDIRELADLLLIRGKWSTPLMSQQLSESFHILLQSSDELLSFDESLSETGDAGLRIYNLLRKAERSKDAVKLLRETIKEINAAAFAIIQTAAQNLVVLGKNFKIALEDYGRSAPELVLNWKEIEAASGGRIKALFVEVYKKIYYFVQLMQVLLKDES